MKKIKTCFNVLLLAVFLMTGCGDDSSNSDALNINRPTVISTVPSNGGTNVALNGRITATFSRSMDAATITTDTFVLRQAATIVPCIVTYKDQVATLDIIAGLAMDTVYSVTVTTGVKDTKGNALYVNKSWSFTTGANMPVGPAPINLGTAGNFVILSKSGIDTVPTSVIIGNIGVSPIDSTGITGFDPVAMDSSNVFSRCDQVVGKVYASNYAVPTPANMTTAISDMEAAYTYAAGQTTPDFTELGAGDISGLTLVPGLYKWGTGVLISTDITLNGNSNDVWIFQISDGVTIASGVKILLAGGAKAKNVFWQTFGAVKLGTTAHLEGIVLSQTEITLATGATVNGRLLSQTAVTIDNSNVIQPTQ